MNGVDISSLPIQTKRSRTWTDLLRMVGENVARDLRVCMPAQVIKVRGNQLVDLQPHFKAKYFVDSTPTSLPAVCHCPVLAPIGQDYALVLPIAVGDTGLLLCTDRSLDTWMAGAGAGTAVDPGDDRTHALTDAIFVPGMVPETKQTTEPASSDLVIRNGSTQIRLEKSGMVRIINSQGHEVVDLTIQAIDALTSLTNILASSQTITALGPSPTLWAAAQTQLAQLQSQIATIKGYLSTLKGP